jgi:hypothetical protein
VPVLLFANNRKVDDYNNDQLGKLAAISSRWHAQDQAIVEGPDPDDPTSVNLLTDQERRDKQRELENLRYATFCFVAAR